MYLTVNGSALDLPPDASVAHLIERLGSVGQRLAVEINGIIVARSGYADTALHEGDQVEIVQAIGGG